MPPKKKSSKAFDKLVQSFLSAKYPKRPKIPEGFDYVEPALYDCAHVVYQDDNSSKSCIYLGPKAAASRDAMDSLKAANIRGIVNCTPDFPCYHSSEGIAYCQVPVHDIDTADILVYFQGATAFMHHILEQGGSVLVHCQFGVSRSASVVIAYYIMYQKLSRDDAYVAVKTKRPKISPNEGFWKQLKVFENQNQVAFKEKNEKVDEERPPKESGGIIAIDKSWATSSNAIFATCQDIPSILEKDKSWKQLVHETTEPNQVLSVCLDFIWSRGLVKVDLQWCKKVCSVLEENPSMKEDPIDIIFSILQDEDSEFCRMWAGEIYPEQIQRLRRHLSEDDL